MGCKDRMEFVRRGGVWTEGSTNSANFVPLTEPIRVGEYDGFRTKLEMRASSGDIEFRRGVTYSEDGISWETPSNYDSATWETNTGFYYGSSFTSPSASKRWFRLGLFAQNDTGTDIEEISCTMTVELANR